MAPQAGAENTAVSAPGCAPLLTAVYTGGMHTDALIDFCRKLPYVVEDIKWCNDRVFSIRGGKMFWVS